MQVKTLLRRLENNSNNYDLIYIHKNTQQLINFDSYEENLNALRDKNKMESSSMVQWRYCFKDNVLKAKVKNTFDSISHIPFHTNERILNIIIESEE